MLNEELYDLYKRDPAFKSYVDAWCKKHDLSIFEAFTRNILREYAKQVKENNK